MQQLIFAPFNKKGKQPSQEELDKLAEQGQDYEYDYPQERKFRVENKSNYIKEGSRNPLKYRDMVIKGLGLQPISFTAAGMP